MLRLLKVIHTYNYTQVIVKFQYICNIRNNRIIQLLNMKKATLCLIEIAELAHISHYVIL